MRRCALVFLFCLILLCLIGCEPRTSDIDGVWRGWLPAAVQIEMRLSEKDGIVTGTGTYFISGPRPTGTFEVRGSFSDPTVGFAILYDVGSRVVFDGTLDTPATMVGNVTWITRTGETAAEAVTFYKDVG